MKIGFKLLTMSLLLSTPLYAQKSDVLGKVVDEKGNPIYGVVATSADSKMSGVSDREGIFKINAKIGERISLASINNCVKEVVVADSVINVVLEAKDKQQIIGHQIFNPLRESVQATASIDADALHKTSINPSNSLFGMLPGLQVMQTTGNVWGDEAKFFVRGLGTTNGKEPLILVDGLERSISELTVQEIESVSVLKDGPALSLYGIRGANGVVYITTKRGVQTKPEITLSYEFNMGKPQKLPKFVDAFGYANALNEGLKNDGLEPRYSQRELEAYQSGEFPDFFPNVDWVGESLRKYSFGDNVNFSIRGGGKVAKYFTQLNFLDDRGILGPTGGNDGYSTQFKYSKLNIRTNLDIKLSKSTDLKLNLLGNFSEHNRPGKTADDIFDALYQVPSGAFPIKTSNGLWGGTKDYGNNPMALISGTGYARAQGRTLFADFTLGQRLDVLTKGLSAEVTVGLDHSSTYWDADTRKFAYEEGFINWDNLEESSYKKLQEETPLSFGSSIGSISRHFNLKTRVNYDRTFDKHSLNAKVGYSLDKSNNKGRNNTFAFMDIYTYLHYAFDNRYAVDFSLTGSASSVLDPDDRWGVFSSIGAAWVLSEESFMKRDWLNLLKLRLSYGTAGYANYGVNLYKDIYSGGNGYFFKDAINEFGGTAEKRLAMNGLTYETSRKFNAGFDFMAFNKLSFTFDAFYDRRKDILVAGAGSISSVLGIAPPFMNNGEVKNYGFEMDLRWRDKIRDFSYELGGMFTFSRNEIVNMNEVYRPHDYLKRTGKPLGQLFGYEVEGIYQTQEEIDKRDVKQYLSDVRPGDLKFKDQNNDGRIDEYDMVAIGYNSICPEIYYGFDLNAEYKGVGIYAQFQGVANFSKVLNTKSIYRPLVNNNTISTEYYDNRWTPENPNAKYPRLTTEGSLNNFSNNSLWIADASFIKLRTLELYYNFPKQWFTNVALKDARFYVRAHDLLSFNKIKVQDPEAMGVGHPLMKQLVFGINVKF